MNSRNAPQIGFSFEYVMWVFTRISGLALFLLLGIGVIGALLMGARTQMHVGELMRWTFFPNSYHIANTEVPDAALWATAYWQVMQVIVLFFAVTHGINGLRVVLEDYLNKSWLLILVRGLLFLIWIFILLAAVNIVYTY